MNKRLTQPLSPKQVLVTGASGFIGTRLVKNLIESGERVRALVRRTTDTSQLEALGCELFVSDLLCPDEALDQALSNCDVVYHLAAETKAVRSNELIKRNLTTVRNLLQAMVRQARSPRLVFVSSMAAVGPSTEAAPLTESSPRHPISSYGFSKAACEREVERFAGKIDISVVRPPIVLGPGDSNGLMMFKIIESVGIHFVPGFTTRKFSIIHVEDLCQALVAVDQRGTRLRADGISSANVAIPADELERIKRDVVDSVPLAKGQGVYFVGDSGVWTFAELGRMIGQAMGRGHTWVIYVILPLLWLVAMINELRGRLVNRPQYLNYDKYLEASSGSWWCSSNKLKGELGFEPSQSMQEHLSQTVTWYREHGWLKPAAKVSGSGSKPQDSRPQERSFG